MYAAWVECILNTQTADNSRKSETRGRWEAETKKNCGEMDREQMQQKNKLLQKVCG